jgi:hypothetical protein
MLPSFLAVKMMAVKVTFNRAVGLKPNQNSKEKNHETPNQGHDSCFTVVIND